MNWLVENSLEYIMSHFSKNQMIDFVKTNPKQFEKLVDLVLLHNNPLSARAAWLLSHCVDRHDKRIDVHFRSLINVLKEATDGKQRDIISSLTKVGVPEEYEGEIFDLCVEIWSKIGKIPSVRYKAFFLIIEIAKKHPELGNEILVLAEDYYLDPLSPGIRKVCKKLINQFLKEYLKTDNQSI